MLVHLYKSFPGLFDRPAQDDEFTGGEEEGDRGESGPFAEYDLFPLILDYCKETNETLTTALNESVIQVFFICDYVNTRRIEEKKQMDKIMKKH